MDLGKELERLEEIFFKDEEKLKKSSEEIRKKVNKRVITLNKKFPDATLLNEFEIEVKISDLIKEEETLVFLSGGNWCPYSNLNIKYLISHSDTLKRKGYGIISISKDIPSSDLTVHNKVKLPISMLSDIKSILINTMNITYTETVDTEEENSDIEINSNQEEIFPTLFIINNKLGIEKTIVSDDKLYIEAINEIINDN